MSDMEELTPVQVRTIESAYAGSMDDVDREDASHVLAKEAKARKKVEPLLSEDRWVHFGRQILLLFGMLKAWWRDEFELPWKCAAAITAALLYFLNPFDIVPDFIPVVGYLDDAVVVGACLKLIQVDLRAYAASKGLDLTDYGL